MKVLSLVVVEVLKLVEFDHFGVNYFVLALAGGHRSGAEAGLGLLLFVHLLEQLQTQISSVLLALLVLKTKDTLRPKLLYVFLVNN